MKVNWSNYYKMSAISFVTTLFSHLIIFFIGNYAVLYFAYDFDIGAWFDISGAYFDQLRNSPLWTYDAEVTIFLSKPLLALTIAILSLSLLLLIDNLKIVSFMLLLWLNIVSFNACFGLFVDDFITQSGVTYVAERMEINLMAMIFSVAVTTFIMIRLGMVNSTIFSLLLPQRKNTPAKDRFIIVFMVIIMPWIFSGLAIFAFANSSHELLIHLNTISTLLIIIPFLFNKGKDIKNPDTKKIELTSFDWIISGVLLLISVILYTLMLSPIKIWAV